MKVSATVYWSSVSGNLITKREQQHIFDILAAHHLPFTPIDIAAAEHVAHKDILREGPRGLRVPQIWVQGVFRAGYEEFLEAVENGLVEELVRPELPEEETPLH